MSSFVSFTFHVVCVCVCVCVCESIDLWVCVCVCCRTDCTFSPDEKMIVTGTSVRKNEVQKQISLSLCLQVFCVCV